MTNDKTDYHEAQVLDRIFDNADPDGAVDGVYVALWSSTPSNNPDESEEISGDEYSPVEVPADEWSVDSGSGPREYVNDNEVHFDVLDTSSDTTVAGVVLFDGSDTSSDNALYINDDFDSQTVESGNEFKFNPGELTVSED